MRKLLLLLALLTAPLGADSALQMQMDRLMAGFVSTFPAYVSWPTKPAVMRVGFIGPNPLGAAGREYLSQHSYGGRPYALEMLQPGQFDLNDLRQFHMLFFGQVVDDEIKRVLKIVEKEPILTIGVTPDFLELGGIVQFNVRGKAITFDVSTANARTAGLVIDPRLITYGRTM